MMHLVRKLFAQREGGTLIEYALVTALISIIALAAMELAGSQLNITFQNVATALANAN